ncbi:BREX system P-loop protein BrxC, partial [Butyricicoccus sp. 1XD8-22]
QVDEINSFKARYEGRKYPGLSLLNKGLEYFGQFNNQLDNASFFLKLKEMEDDLADWEEDIVYVKSFFESNQKDIFDRGLAGLVKYEENKSYLSGNEVEKEMHQLRNIVENPIPYKNIKDIPDLLHALEQQIEAVLVEKKANANEKLQADYNELVLQATQYGVSNETKHRVEQYYQGLKASLEQFTDIFKVDATISQSNSYKEKTLKEIRQEIAEWQRRKAEEQKRNAGTTAEPIEPVVQKQTVKVKELVTVKTLSTEEEVDLYINTLSHKLKQIIKANKQIEFIE